jgi:hypothetical protein
MSDSAATRAGQGGRAARLPGAVFAVLALAVLVLVATALNPAQPPPPAVAEYAPAAVKAITEAPPDQVAQDGTGKSTAGGNNGTNAGASPPPLPSASAPSLPGKVIDVNRVSRCVGDPPRQTEDPQSPPCIPYFDGDNGGATWTGVTRNEIRIAMPNATSQDVDLLTRYFNTRFQFYGRQIKIVRDVGCFGGNPSSEKSSAEGVAALKVFGDVGFCDTGGVEYYFFDELARRGVVSVNNRVSAQYEKDMAKFHPFEWAYLPPYDKTTRHLSELACTMKGKTASHAGAAYLTSTRKFGMISNKFDDAPSPDMSAALTALKACGIEPVTAQVTYDRGAGTTQGATPQTAQEVASAIVKMRDAGVTTLLVVVHAITARQIVNALDSQGYEPEIGISTDFYNDEDVYTTTYPKSQSSHMFGISTWSKFVHVQDEPWYAAIKEMDPGHTFTEGNNVPPFSYAGARYDYEPMLVMAAGIQMAGPHLTPETFAKGLQSAAWPNPFTPHWPGKVTVSPGSHSYVDDAAAIWWDDSSRSEYSTGGSGMFCYVENGVRRRLGAWPRNDGLFVRPCQRF